MKNSNFLSKKIFNIRDQKKFASLSGDYNPIHINQIEARKSLVGNIIVHGINTFLWSLEYFIKQKESIYTSFKINFLYPLSIGDSVELYWNEEKKELIIKNIKGIVFCSIKCSKKKKSVDSLSIIPRKNKVLMNPVKLEPTDLKKKVLIKFNTGNKNYAKKLFPNLSNKLGEDIVYEIAGLSSIVGMYIPGLKSLFIGLELDIRKKNIKESIKILKQNNLGMILLEYTGKNIFSKMRACFTPDPIITESCESIKNKLKINFSLNGYHILVIGGSRGLGSVVSKIAIIYGAKVTLTYYKGLEEAKLIENDVEAFGGDLTIKYLDVTNDKSIKNILEIYDHIYYFPTPKIKKNISNSYDQNLHNRYLLYYVEGFRNITKLINMKKQSKIMYPSTIFIDKKSKGLSEYIDAKIKGELFCSQFASKKSLIIYTPRIPAVLTDQNISLIPKKYEDIVKVANNLVVMMSTPKLEK